MAEPRDAATEPPLSPGSQRAQKRPLRRAEADTADITRAEQGQAHLWSPKEQNDYIISILRRHWGNDKRTVTAGPILRKLEAWTTPSQPCFSTLGTAQQGIG